LNDRKGVTIRLTSSYVSMFKATLNTKLKYLRTEVELKSIKLLLVKVLKILIPGFVTFMVFYLATFCMLLL